MDPFTLALGAAIGSPVISAAVAALVARGKKAKTSETHEPAADPASNDFKCPYCQLLIIGAQNLDILTHMECITKSKEDLEAMRTAEAKKPKVAKDEYFAKYTRHTTDFSGQYNSPHSWTRVANTRDEYQRVTWELFRNGESIASGGNLTHDDAKSTLEQAQKLDEHKRRAKRK